MNIENIKKRNNGNKSILVTIRVTPKLSKWLRDKNYSPTGIFYEAVNDLGYNEEEE